MAYKVDDRRIYFTLEGIILANNECNSLKLNMKHYIDRFRGKAVKPSEDEIHIEINKRRAFNNAVFRAVNQQVMARLMQQDQSGS